MSKNLLSIIPPPTHTLPTREASSDIAFKISSGVLEEKTHKDFEKGTLFLEKTQYVKAPYIRLFTGVFYDKLSLLSPTAMKTLLYILKSHILPYNHFLYSSAVFAEDLGISRMAIYRAIEELKAKNIITESSTMRDDFEAQKSLYDTVMRSSGKKYRYSPKSVWYYVSHNLLWAGSVQFLLEIPEYEQGIKADIRNRTQYYWNLLARYGKPTIEDSLHDSLQHGRYLQHKLYLFRQK